MEESSQYTNATTRLERSSLILNNALKDARETVDIGVATLSEIELGNARLKIMNQKMQIINDDISHSRRIMNNMKKKMWQNKCTLFLIIMILLIAIILSIYFKFIAEYRDGSMGASTVMPTTTQLPIFTLP
jgi:hypothetical protein